MLATRGLLIAATSSGGKVLVDAFVVFVEAPEADSFACEKLGTGLMRLTGWAGGGGGASGAMGEVDLGGGDILGRTCRGDLRLAPDLRGDEGVCKLWFDPDLGIVTPGLDD